jgi:hypothetical protein
LSCQPQPDKPQPLQFSRFTSVAADVPIRQIAAPELLTELLNCTNTESFAQLLLSALLRTQSW